MERIYYDNGTRAWEILTPELIQRMSEPGNIAQGEVREVPDAQEACRNLNSID